jgi:hypothetical protein
MSNEENIIDYIKEIEINIIDFIKEIEIKENSDIAEIIINIQNEVNCFYTDIYKLLKIFVNESYDYSFFMKWVKRKIISDAYTQRTKLALEKIKENGEGYFL